jgi:hypothetical protein
VSRLRFLHKAFKKGDFKTTVTNHPFSGVKMETAEHVGSAKQYNSKQMDRALLRVKERKNARQKAKDEEKCYVEYRKQQVLSSFRPTVGALRVGDDVSSFMSSDKMLDFRRFQSVVVGQWDLVNERLISWLSDRMRNMLLGSDARRARLKQSEFNFLIIT